MVNIAVFAAFHDVIGIFLLSNPEFKPVCAIWQLDIWRYGRQKRQETATSGKVSGKNGKSTRGYQGCPGRRGN